MSNIMARLKQFRDKFVPHYLDAVLEVLSILRGPLGTFSTRHSVCSRSLERDVHDVFPVMAFVTVQVLARGKATR